MSLIYITLTILSKVVKLVSDWMWLQSLNQCPFGPDIW